MSAHYTVAVTRCIYYYYDMSGRFRSQGFAGLFPQGSCVSPHVCIRPSEAAIKVHM